MTAALSSNEGPRRRKARATPLLILKALPPIIAFIQHELLKEAKFPCDRG